MNRRRAVEWLMGEIPGLVEKGVISGETARGLKSHYGEITADGGKRWGRTAFAVLGGLLVGLGIILVFAHNWDGLSRAWRTVLSLAPLILGQALCAWVIARRPGSAAWREGSGTFLFLALGASISLVAQTYHMGRDVGAFILSWMLPGLPIVYAMDATVPALMYLAGITSWGGHQRFTDGNQLWFWAMVVPLIPHFIRLLKEETFGWRPVLLGWGAAVCGGIAVGYTPRSIPHGSWHILYAFYFSLLGLASLWRHGDWKMAGRRSFLVAGVTGLCGATFAMTFRWPWASAQDLSRWYSMPGIDTILGSYSVMGVMAAGVAAGLARSAMRRNIHGMVMGGIPVLALLAYILVAGYGLPHMVPVVLFNLLFLAAGTAATVWGIRGADARTANTGMVMVTALVGARFFDSGFGILARGIVFILLGAGFLAANVAIWRRKAPR